MTTPEAHPHHPLPVLYSFRRCPYAMRARLALRVAGQAVAHRDIELKHKPAAMLQASPKGTVPVLVLSDGAVLEQSLDIMRWALERHDPEAWLPADEASRQDAWALIAQNDGDFKFHLDRYKYPHRYDLADGLAHRAQAAFFFGGVGAAPYGKRLPKRPALQHYRRRHRTFCAAVRAYRQSMVCATRLARIGAVAGRL